MVTGNSCEGERLLVVIPQEVCCAPSSKSDKCAQKYALSSLEFVSQTVSILLHFSNIVAYFSH